MLKIKNTKKARESLETEQHLEAYDKAVYSWTAPEYIQHDKDKNWYIAEALAVGFLMLISIISSNYTMSLALVTLVIVYHYLQIKHPPKNIKIIISKIGIKVGNLTFPYSHIQSFWIMYNPPFLKTLNFRVKRHFFVDVTVQLVDTDPVTVRHFLSKQIPELKGKTEQFSDFALRLLKL